ncbi:MAG: hypothetical protein IJG33_11400 [Selenomonadaceae bacterium]|nr:hypothetical protein [Selenomonadaceae bacterium]
MALKELSEKLYPAFIESFKGSKLCRLFLSASTMKERAVVRHAVRTTPEQAWEVAIAALEKFFADKEQPTVLRVDWVTSTASMRWAEYVDKIQTRKRGWFRHGLAIDKDYKLAFTEQELNANSIIYSSKEEKTKCEFQPRNADIYCRQRFERAFPKMKRKDKIELFNTSAIFIQDGMDEPLKLISNGDFAERRPLNQDEPELFISMAKAAAKYLVAQCQDDGLFVYGFYPCNDEVIDGYNIHRHLGTLFAMAEVYSISDAGDDKEELGKAIERGLEYAINNHIVYRKAPDGEDIAYLNDGKRSTVGMSGLALLALTKWTTATGTRKYIPLMNSIARSIFSVQKADGTLIHALNLSDFSVRKDFAVPYYDGEAIYGMLRLYAITKAPELLESCERILNRLIETEYWKNYDHWLAYATNEFTLYRPEEKYFELGLNNTLPYLPKLVNAHANSPIRLEQVMATAKMIERMKSLPEMKPLLERVDEETFYSTVKFRADQLLNAYFFPEVAMYFQNPARILNSFFVRDDSFRVRIDDVQHTISGFLAYAAYLKGEFDFDKPVEDLQPAKETSKPVEDLQTTEETAKPVEDLQTAKETSKPVEDLQPAEEIELGQMTRKVIQVGSVRITIESEQPERPPQPASNFPQPIWQENPLLQVGIMKKGTCKFWELSNPRYPLFCMAKHFNIELLLFEPEDIDFKDKTVKAIALENNSKVEKVAPLPRIIDNDIAYFHGETAAIMEQLGKQSYLIRPASIIKSQPFSAMISKDEHFKDLLIDTQAVRDFNQLLSLLDKYQDDVILKPTTGGGNKSLVRIHFDNGRYVATVNGETITLKSINSLLQFYEEISSQKNYIVQPYCMSRTRQGNPFTIRLHTRRGAEGQAKVFAYPQIGRQKDLVPAVSYTMDFEDFLKAEFGKDWKTLRDKLMNLGQDFPESYQSFLKGTLFEMGLDVCIQRNGDAYDLKIFEAYIQPDFANISNEIAVTSFEYYQYLNEKFQDGSLK